MFWKNKKKIEIEIPGEDEDHRNAFRIMPESARPVILNIAGDSHPLVNISGTGCCFRSYNYPEGFEAAATLRIPSDDIIFPVTIRVISRQKDLCRSEFVRIAPKSEDAIHAYVLNAQKSIIRKK